MEHLLAAKLDSTYTYKGTKKNGRVTMAFEEKLLARMINGMFFHYPITYSHKH
jgi:hypothetical protein